MQSNGGNKTRFGWRLVGLTIVASFAISLVGFTSIYNQKDDLLEHKQTYLKHIVETAISVADGYYKRAQAGEITEEEAKQRALDAIGFIRHGKGEYLWVNDINSVIIMHPVKPALAGKDLSKLEDKNGKLVFPAFVEVIEKTGRGYVDYVWPKPGHENPVKKLSYVQSDKKWGWIIGTSVYLDDLKVTSNERIEFLVAIIIATLITTILIFSIVGRSIAKQHTSSKAYPNLETTETVVRARNR